VEKRLDRIFDTCLKTIRRRDPILQVTLIELCRATADWPADPAAP